MVMHKPPKSLSLQCGYPEMMIVIKRSNSPATKEGCMGNPADPKREGPHAEPASMRPAHLFHISETSSHVRLQLCVDLLLLPHESLYVLSNQTQKSQRSCSSLGRLRRLWKSQGGMFLIFLYLGPLKVTYDHAPRIGKYIRQDYHSLFG